jgi:hypothetical protein
MASQPEDPAMRIFTRRAFLTLLAASLLLLTSLPSLHAAAPAERSARLTILQLNDMYDFMPMDSDLVLERLKAGPIAPSTDGRIQVAP